MTPSQKADRLRDLEVWTRAKWNLVADEEIEIGDALLEYAALLEAKGPPEATGARAVTVMDQEMLGEPVEPGQIIKAAGGPFVLQEQGKPVEPLPALANRVTELETERDALAKDNHDLRTVMIAAAEEISEHWQAHCDADGYGPSNLLRRLEIGIPSEYGYTAGAFRKLKEELAAAELAAVANLHAAQRTNLTLSVHMHCTACGGSGLLGGLPCHCREPLTKGETP